MKSKKPSLDTETLLLGPLPTDAINWALDLDLEPGVTVLTAIISKHVRRRHPDDHARCLPHVASVVAAPLYVGDDFRNPGKIELIGRVSALGSALLVAVEMTRNERGEYEVRSFYPVKDGKVQHRLQRGFLKRVQKR
ncbi:hypothetical protein [Azospirillum sp.]|uniref:PBECR3 domain-containing polyvalent protein n=1 Tax=Azospirillum sp. TaxID=34012 RepID=UPI003D74CCD8